MNPSATGWIQKLTYLVRNQQITLPSRLDTGFFALRQTGFLYGNSIGCSVKLSDVMEFSQEEYTKLNLVLALLTVYMEHNEDPERSFSSEVLRFYNGLSGQDIPNSSKITPDTKHHEILEKRIHSRVRIDLPILERNFSYLLTNALLFIDVLAFKSFLTSTSSPADYIAQREALLLRTISYALRSKKKTTTHDEMLIQLFTVSARYAKSKAITPVPEEALEFSIFQSVTERRYVLTLACLAVWDDYTLDSSENKFIHSLGRTLGLSATDTADALAHVWNFIENFRNQIPYLTYVHPVQQFYSHTSGMVKLLILRNKRRLYTELQESKTLINLLAQSTVRDLDVTEKEKVKEQLLDICKTVPSLAIFVLPGGSLLMPLLIKFIPKLLPSAFRENRISENPE